MGVVYRAHDERLGRDVAIKVLPAASLEDPISRERLLREARTASKLNHPNICTIHEVGEAGGSAFIAMELVEGRSLLGLLSEGFLSVDRVLDYGLQMADALAHAHERGVVHRDFKSANVVVTPEGRAKVLDFGLARRLRSDEFAEGSTLTKSTLTVTGTIMGTPAYMAPEQLCGQPADERSDVWALGVVLYEMAVGTRPFQGRTGAELGAAILSQDPPFLVSGERGAFPRVLRPVVGRCLEKAPDRRYQNGKEVWAALQAVRASSASPLWPTLRGALARRPFVAAAAVLILLFAVLAVLNIGELSERLALGPAGPAFRALAVLPITNLTGDPEQDYFSDGMTDALITDLSKIGALRVISRMSVMRYKGVAKPLAEIARELSVDAVLAGTVVREAGRVRVSAQLVDAATERNLWADSFDRDFSGILAVQAEVAREVARAISVHLSPEEQSSLESARTVNPATYEAYLKGMFYLNRSGSEDTLKGIAYLHEAVEKDPADPLAYAGLALGYIEIAHGAEARDDSLSRAKAAAEIALKLDDSLAEVQVAMGFVKGYYEWQWQEAFEYLDRALQINPSLAIAYYHRSWYHALFGRMEEAIEDHIRARELDPFNPLHTAWLGELYRMEGRLEEAEEEALKSIAMSPDFAPGHFVLGLVYRDRGMYEEAIEAMRKASEASRGRWKWALGITYARAGRLQEALAVLEELNALKTDPFRAFGKAMLYTALEDNDEAFRWLNYRPHHAFLAWIGRMDWVTSLRDDPRLPELLARMNVSQ
jgi:eukaryotic-like serine/threonine-protein kinase